MLLLWATGTPEARHWLQVVPLAQFLAVVVATVFGTAIPFLCLRVRVEFRGRTWTIDPALAAGPFITTLNDVISTAIALSLALWVES
jgi:magnesium transporter